MKCKFKKLKDLKIVYSLTHYIQTICIQMAKNTENIEVVAIDVVIQLQHK